MPNQSDFSNSIKVKEYEKLTSQNTVRNGYKQSNLEQKYKYSSEVFDKSPNSIKDIYKNMKLKSSKIFMQEMIISKTDQSQDKSP